MKGLILSALCVIFVTSCQICEVCDMVTVHTVSDPTIPGYPRIDSAKSEVCGRKRDQDKPIAYDSTFQQYGVNGPYTLQITQTVKCSKKPLR